MVERKKTRVLMVSFNLGQHGSERFLFELCKAFDRDRFEIEVLTRFPKLTQYYEPKLRELGIPIHHRMPRFLHLVRRFARPFFVFRPTRAIVESAHRLWMHFSIGGLLDRFDVIAAIQIENYYLIQPLVRTNEKVVVHLMSHAVQYAVNPYLDCEAGRSYRFVLFDPAQAEDYAAAPCSGADTFDFPLALDVTAFSDLSAFIRTAAPFRIAIFQRLHPKEHPFTGFFNAFARILQTMDAELFVYGDGDAGVFIRELDQLGIREHVKFVGHTASMERALREDRISIVWQNSIGPAIGYASIEVAAYGFPLLFWSIIESEPESLASQTGGALLAYHDPARLADETIRLLRDPGTLLAFGAKLRKYVFREYDIRRHIGRLEDFIEVVANESRGVVPDQLD
jgi:glycosyltransferase involved in cell wall biosynthesis